MTSQASSIDGGRPTAGMLLPESLQQAGLTQEGWGDRAGISVRGLSNLERGVNAVPRRDPLAFLVDALSHEQERSLTRAVQRQPE
jgi:transcriptional regulator with XRE-family HTH domain